MRDAKRIDERTTYSAWDTLTVMAGTTALQERACRAFEELEKTGPRREISAYRALRREIGASSKREAPRDSYRMAHW